MEVKILSEMTPNPNAYRFVTNYDIKINGHISFDANSEMTKIELFDEILKLKGIENIFILENCITITKLENISWDDIEISIKKILKKYLPSHDPNFKIEEKKREYRKEIQKDIEEINSIIDKSIRSYLQSDGGDIEIIDLNDNILTIEYKGACGSCPSSTYGTLLGIENILRKEFNSNIEVKAIGIDDNPEEINEDLFY